MDSTGQHVTQKQMNFAIRPMELGDIKQAAEVEKEAFPTLWPPTPFRKELQNRLARYLVAYDKNTVTEPPAESQPSYKSSERSFLRKLVDSVKNFFEREEEAYMPALQESIVGIVGVWYMVDEAHIATIGVRPPLQRKGIGELLLIGCIEQAIVRKSRVVTLEVRVSNKEARALYKKYRFEEVGLRKRYYSDNDEDAIIMTTPTIQERDYQEFFAQQVTAHAQRWGESERVVS